MDPMLISLMTVVATVAAAFGGVKVALNGTVKRVNSIDEKLTQHIRDEVVIETQVAERLVRVETKIDALVEKQYENRKTG